MRPDFGLQKVKVLWEDAVEVKWIRRYSGSRTVIILSRNCPAVFRRRKTPITVKIALQNCQNRQLMQP